MDVIPQTLLFLGIIPALFLLFISLKNYDGMYKDKIMFLMFIAGIITGVFSIIIEYLTYNVGYIKIILFPLLEHLFITVILNLKRFQNKKETTVYGLSIGLGFGSVFTPYLIIVFGLFYNDTNALYIAFVTSISIIILHGATGVLIGYGVYKSDLVKYFFYAVILYIPVVIGYPIKYSAIAVIPYSLIVYWYVTTKIMPNILKKGKNASKTK